ncbi:MAG: hypothetical protein DID89_2727547035 [Candidatus Nitrotoga sp. CP45]|nr:MAG: hypothetical protein DID89_2727547035 [Candidatus Nitrotoga sp. CP45]
MINYGFLLINNGDSLIQLPIWLKFQLICPLIPLLAIRASRALWHLDASYELP